jgi:4'-phosphopantetheinyl transferase
MNNRVTINHEQAHLWVCDPCKLRGTGHLSRYLGILSPAERERMQRFHFEPDRLAFLAAHGLARTALSSCAPSVPPEGWVFGDIGNGRPEIVAPHVKSVLRFNISHTPQLVACLVTVQIDCGIDVETLDRVIDVRWFADRVLSRAEYARILAVPTHAQRDLFFKHWTLKEAYVKARGYGISFPLERCAFELRPEGIKAGFEASLNDDETDWQFAQWAPTERHLLAVALRCGRLGNYQIVRHYLLPGLP